MKRNILGQNDAVICKIEIGCQYSSLKEARNTLYKVANEQYRNGNVTIAAAISGQVMALHEVEKYMKEVSES
jgi:hypothetical protein